MYAPEVPPPLAYLITWTTHGTWLHGDPRGSADREGGNTPGTPYLSRNDSRSEFERSELNAPAVIMDQTSRATVARTIRDHCDHRGWRIHALNVRTNHVHVVVTAPVPPEKIMGEFKAWASRRLREDGLIEPGKVWTRHGSTRYLNDETSVHGAIRYVRDGQ